MLLPFVTKEVKMMLMMSAYLDSSTEYMDDDDDDDGMIGEHGRCFREG